MDVMIGPSGAGCLFNVVEDPEERENLAPSMPELVVRIIYRSTVVLSMRPRYIHNELNCRGSVSGTQNILYCII